MTDAGRHGLGHSYQLTFDHTTFTTHHRNLALGYVTSADQTCATFDASAWGVANAIQFAGIALIDMPHVNIADVLTSSWASTDYSSQYGEQPGPHKWEVTTLHRCRTDAIADETISPGDPVMMGDVADHVTTLLEEHNGMLGVADTGTANEMYVCIGIAETGATVEAVAANHDVHEAVWDADLGEFTDTHPLFWVQLWK